MLFRSVQEDMEPVWLAHEPVEVGDFKFAAQGLGFLREVMMKSQERQWAREKVLHDKLRKGGVQLNIGRDGGGQFLLVFERASGE